MPAQLKLHPILNLTHCFRISKSSQLSSAWANYQAPKNWLRNLSELIVQPNLTANNIYLYLENHLYTSPRLKPLLQRFHALLSGRIKDKHLSFDPNQIHAYAQKLTEGILACTQGYEDRLNQLWQGWLMCQSLSDRVQTLREELVLRTAYAAGNDDVHFVNQATNYAHDLGYGISPINTHDSYGRSYCMKRLQHQLINQFNQHFKPLAILMHIEIQLRDELRAWGYQGRKPLESAYRVQNCHDWMELLSHQLRTDPDFSWFITLGSETDNLEDEQYIFDLNWCAIRQQLLKQLQSEQLFHPITDTKELLQDCYLDEINYYYENISDTDQRQLYFSTLTDLKSLVHFHQNIPMDRPILEKRLRILLGQDPSRINTLTTTPCLLQNQQLNALLLKFINPPTPIKLMALFQQQNTLGETVLMSICRYGNPELLATVLKSLSKLKPVDRIKLLLIKNAEGQDVFHAASKSFPDCHAALALYHFCRRHGIFFADFYFDRILTPIDTAIITNTLKIDNQTSRELFTFLLTLKMRHQNYQALGQLLIKIVESYPHHLDQFLTTVGSLADPIKATLYQQVSNKRTNAFMEAVKQPSTLTKLLNSLYALSDETARNRCLTQQDNNNNNALLIAAGNSAQGCSILLESITDPAVKMQLLTDINQSGYNALMMAACHQPNALFDIVEAIRALDSQTLTHDILKTQHHGMRALDLVLNTNHQAAEAILNLILSLENETHVVDLLTRGKAIMVTATSNPDAFSRIITHSNKFSATARERLLKSLAFNQLNSKQLLSILDLVKQYPIPDTTWVMKQIHKQVGTFSPNDWYTVIVNNLISVEHIKNHKEDVLKHIKTLSGEQRRTTICESLNPQSRLGIFFHTQRGLRRCRESAGTLKQLTRL